MPSRLTRRAGSPPAAARRRAETSSAPASASPSVMAPSIISAMAGLANPLSRASGSSGARGTMASSSAAMASAMAAPWRGTMMALALMHERPELSAMLSTSTGRNSRQRSTVSSPSRIFERPDPWTSTRGSAAYWATVLSSPKSWTRPQRRMMAAEPSWLVGIQRKRLGRQTGFDHRLDDAPRRPRLLASGFEHDRHAERERRNPQRIDRRRVARQNDPEAVGLHREAHRHPVLLAKTVVEHIEVQARG